MPRKGKTTNHTAKELAAKVKASTQNAGGGSAGITDRKGGKAGHSKFLCYICKQQAPDLKSMKLHHDSKHDKIPWDEARYQDLHQEFGGTTQGVAVRGSTKKK